MKRRMEMSVQTLTQDVKKRSGWSIFMGVLSGALGVFLHAYPPATATLTTVLLAWTLVLVGIARIVFALHSQTPGNFFLKLLSGLLYGITGLVLAIAPLDGVAALTAVLGGLLVVQAGLAPATALPIPPPPRCGVYLFDATSRHALGTLLPSPWPS